MNHRLSGGYVGLLMLLVTTLIMGILIWRTDLFSTKSSIQSDQPNVSPIQRDLQAVKSAEEARKLMEAKYHEQTAELQK